MTGLKRGKSLEQINEQSKFRKYILGNVSEAERAAIDERLLTDDEYFEEFSMTEENFIQDYIDGNLDKPERERFESCFLNSEENRQKVKFAAALRRYVNETATDRQLQKKPDFFSSLKAFFSSPVPAALAVLTIVGVFGVFAWRNFSNRSDVLVALNKAYKTERPIESRISDFDYAPTKNTRGAGDKTNNIESELAKTLALKAVSENLTAENLQSLGRVYLTEKEFAKAIEQLTKAAKIAPENAKIHNDLGVALMEKAKRLDEGKLENLAKSNEEFAKAIELDKNLLDAYFNQALCIQELNLPNQAKEAWQKYLELDPNSQWSEEARKNLQILETQKPISKTKEEILQEFLQAKQSGDHEKAWQTLSRNREMITGKLIPQQLAFLFVEAKSIGDEAKAKEYLEVMVYTGNLEEEKSSDLFWKDIAKYYSNVSNNKISLLKEAQESVKKAYKFSLEEAYKDAGKEFENARKIFVKAENFQEEKLCVYWLGYIFNRLKNISKSVELLKSVENFDTSKKYKWLSGHTLCWLAINESESGKSSKALEYYEKALFQSKSVSDTYNSQKILSLIADEYKSLKRNDVALKYLQESLELEKLPEASQRQKWRDYEAVTKTFYTYRYYETALAYGKELLNLAFLNDENSFKCDSYSALGAIYGTLKNYDEAVNLTRKSLETAKLLNTDEEKAVESANANLYLGLLEKQRGNLDEALIYYKQATDFFDSSDYQSGRYEAHKGQLFCYLAEKNDREFQNELPKVLKLFENNRTAILEEQNRNSFFEIEQSVYDLAIDYEFGKTNFVTAFDYSEESRARSLLDLQTSNIEVTKDEKQVEIKFSSNVSEPLKLAQIQSEMSENVQLLEYTVLNDRILIWLITKNNLNIAQVKFSSEMLKEKVSTYLSLISTNSEPDEQRKLATELYKTLISPIKDKLDENKEICIIPDKVLFRLPFAALFSDKYLIEEYKIFYAPSANVFSICSKKAEKLGLQISETLLGVGNPTFDQNAFKDLSPLPSAKQEITEITKFYDNSIIFTEKDATKERVKENLNKADVIHLAGHYIVDETSPLLSSLVLAGSEKEESGLANYEIIGEKLSRTRLIVLSACRTGTEKYYDGEGMIGASRTFLATDIPLVVASSWEVDSEATAKLMIAFHRYRKIEKLSTVEALRRSQIDMLADAKFQQTYYWAAFSMLGGYARF
jgi:CHAT domain-containing protein/Tfp pilus assembly protein PilF